MTVIYTYIYTTLLGEDYSCSQWPWSDLTSRFMSLLYQAEPALKSPGLDKSNEENNVINFDWAFRLHMATDLLGRGMRESMFSETKWWISVGRANSYSTQIIGSTIHRNGDHQSFLVPGYGSATLHSNTWLKATRLQVFQHLRMVNITRLGKSIQPALNGKNGHKDDFL